MSFWLTVLVLTGPCDWDLATPRPRVVSIAGTDLRGLAGQVTGGATCVWTFAGDPCCSVEWRPTRALTPIASRAGDGLAGRWVALDDDARITIRRRPDGLEVVGDAIWHGSGDNTHVGAVDGTGRSDHGVLTVSDHYDNACSVGLRRVGRYLVVVDNGRCGGVNVTFDGVYSRSR